MSQFKLLSQNVFWYQGVPFESDQPQNANQKILKYLSEIYLSENIDLYCFQEIQSQETVNSLKSLLSIEGVYTPGNQLRQYGGGVLSKNIIESIESNDLNFDRLIQISNISFQETQLKISNLHLPSNRHLGVEGSKKKKINEMTALLLSHSDLDIICGDFNDYEGSEIYSFMSKNGYFDSADILNKKHLTTGITEKKKRGDFIWINSELKNNIVNYEVIPKEKLIPSGINKTFLSDHLPVIITLEF
ncbi:MAG: hypothetical protein COA79_11200 [Planctomycetota bacterium]|nr:MAG: hypothetical protein COA79_11200 [Planctomycetota bacterium]